MQGSTSSCGQPVHELRRAPRRRRRRRRAARRRSRAASARCRRSASPHCSTSTSWRTGGEQLGVARERVGRRPARSGGEAIDIGRRVCPSVRRRPASAQRRGQPRDGRLDARRVGIAAVAEHEPRRPCRVGSRAAPAVLDVVGDDAARAARAAQQPPVERDRQREHEVDARRRALDPALRQLARERGDEPVAALGVGAARAPQVAVVLAGADQVRERELVERGGAGVGGELLRRQRGREPGRGEDPAEPQRRRERLRRRAEVGDALGVEPLERRERAPVVAELGVVVVLDHEPVGRARPREQRVAPLGSHHRAGRELVARRDDRPRRRRRRRARRRAARRASSGIGTGSSPASRAASQWSESDGSSMRDPAHPAVSQHPEDEPDRPGCSRRVTTIPPGSAAVAADAPEVARRAPRGAPRRRARCRSRGRRRAASAQARGDRARPACGAGTARRRASSA